MSESETRLKQLINDLADIHNLTRIGKNGKKSLFLNDNLTWEIEFDKYNIRFDCDRETGLFQLYGYRIEDGSNLSALFLPTMNEELQLSYEKDCITFFKKNFVEFRMDRHQNTCTLSFYDNLLEFEFSIKLIQPGIYYYTCLTFSIFKLIQVDLRQPYKKSKM